MLWGFLQLDVRLLQVGCAVMHRVKLMFLCLQRGAQKDPLSRVPGARSAGGDEMTDTLQS